MNYLAHFFLAREDEGLIVGNILADHFKGRKYLSLPEEYQRGVVLHRSIDDFTDNHPEVENTKARLRKNYGKFAPVISDVFYDYFLGSDWSDYSDEELKSFTTGIYKVLGKHDEILPERASYMIHHMRTNDWLFHYSSYFGIEKALQGLSRRAKFDNNMYEAISDLKKDEELIREEFKTFFRDIQLFVQEELKRI